MDSTIKPSCYGAYLLRFWGEEGDTKQPIAWHFSLENPHSGERQGFGSLMAVMEFLEVEVGAKVLP